MKGASYEHKLTKKGFTGKRRGSRDASGPANLGSNLGCFACFTPVSFLQAVESLGEGNLPLEETLAEKLHTPWLV